MRFQTEQVLCPGCRNTWSTTVVKRLTSVEADALGDDRVKQLVTITCPSCGYWIYSPLAISSDAGRFTSSAAALRRVGLF